MKSERSSGKGPFIIQIDGEAQRGRTPRVWTLASEKQIISKAKSLGFRSVSFLRSSRSLPLGLLTLEQELTRT